MTQQVERTRRLGIAARAGVAPVRLAGGYRRAWTRFRRDRMALGAVVVLAVVVIFVLSASLIAAASGYDYRAGDLRNQFRPPLSNGHLLGTDGNGRDLLVRLAYGGRVSLMVAGLAGGVTLVVGGIVGIIAGYFGGLADAILMRIVDILLCLPGLSLLILISTVVETGPAGLALIISAVGWPSLARLIRGEILVVRGRAYVDAARAVGASDRWIIARHVLPNVVPLIVVWTSLAIPAFILSESTLSFLNLGVQIPTPSWGNMLQNASEYHTRSWTNVVVPGVAIYITVLAINLVGSGLRDALDPKGGV